MKGAGWPLGFGGRRGRGKSRELKLGSLSLHPPKEAPGSLSVGRRAGRGVVRDLVNPFPETKVSQPLRSNMLVRMKDQKAWVLALALPPTHCVTLGKSFKPPSLNFPMYKIRDMDPVIQES